VDIQMPQLGETVTEGTITRWLKGVGDHVEADEPLFEVSTDKVDSEVPAPAAGTLTEILVQEGETAEVGARLAVIADAEGAAAPAAAAAAAPAAGPPRAEAQAPAAAPEPEAPAPPQPAPPEPAPAPPAEPERPAAAAPPPAPAPAPPREAEQPAAAAAGGALMSPVVRRLLSDYGLDAEDVKGTGEGGRITRNDVLEAAGRQQRAPQAPAAPTAPAAPAAPAPAAAPPQAAPPQAAPAPAPPSPPREAERPAAVAPSPAVGD
jgi:pyruvate dehydrogenase E2 component (dihydrolipoyllysine-residue acetyltransferase)